MTIIYRRSHEDILGERGALTESEMWELEKIIRRVGHFSLIDAVASLIEPHIADTECEGYMARRDYAHTIRTEAGNLPDTKY